jgi:hypothetical protein
MHGAPSDDARRNHLSRIDIDMTMSTEPRCDIAFSFLAQDESLARKLNDLLATRVTTFIYSDAESQKALAGRDGEAVFNRVFGQEARTVAVLYRKGWGERGFTLIEQTAIRNRAFDRGWEFVTFIPLDVPPSVPEWLPKNRIWVGLDRWGIENAAVVLESRVQELGGTPRMETAAEEAARTKEFAAQELQRAAFLSSSDGSAVRAAERHFAEMFAQMQQLCDGQDGFLNCRDLGTPGTGHSYLIWSDTTPLCVVVGWWTKWANTLEGAGLAVAEWERNPFQRYRQELTPLHETSFRLDITHDGELGWRRRNEADGRFYTNRDIADFAIRRLLKRIREQKRYKPTDD